MIRAWTCISIVSLLSGVFLFGQTAETPPAFHLADIHTSPRVTNPYMRDGVRRAGRYTVRTATMVELIRAAYGVDPEKVQVGRAGWISTGST